MSLCDISYFFSQLYFKCQKEPLSLSIFRPIINTLPIIILSLKVKSNSSVFKMNFQEIAVAIKTRENNGRIILKIYSYIFHTYNLSKLWHLFIIKLAKSAVWDKKYVKWKNNFFEKLSNFEYGNFNSELFNTKISISTPI